MPTTTELLQQGVQFHQAGELARAESLYKQVLQADPAHAEGHHLLGLLAHQAGNHDLATALIRKAIALNPQADATHCNLGIVQLGRHQVDEAVASFRQALALNSSNLMAHLNLGHALMSLRRAAEASIHYRHAVALQPLVADLHVNLGAALAEQGMLGEANACFQAALSLNPQHVHALTNLGTVLAGQGQYDQAEKAFRQALRHEPGNARAHYNLGNALRYLGRLDEAAVCYSTAIDYEPGFADALNNLGILLLNQGQGHRAEQLYRRALHFDANHAEAWNNLGNVLMHPGGLEEAEACYRQALRVAPHYAEYHNNLGLALKEQGRLDDAASCFERALGLEPDHPRALWNRCLLRLLQGDFARGWPDFELRWRQPGMVRRSFREPRWDGSPLHGRTILVYAEHGLGDTIQFMRYLALVKSCGGTVLFECPGPLLDAARTDISSTGPAKRGKLLSELPGVDQFIEAGAPLPAFDVQASLLSLPAFFVTPTPAIPAQIPYVSVDPERVNYWRQEITRLCSERYRHSALVDDKILQVGIVWQGNPTHPKDRERSLPLAHFERLAAIKGVRLVSLQLAAGLEQVGQVGFPVVDAGSRFEPNSFEDLAATLTCLDLVVTVDTVAAHVGGALGVPVWLLLPLVPDWRWLTERTDSPWYPTLRLFRQKRRGDWASVFDAVANALTDFPGRPAKT